MNDSNENGPEDAGYESDESVVSDTQFFTPLGRFASQASQSSDQSDGGEPVRIGISDETCSEPKSEEQGPAFGDHIRNPPTTFVFNLEESTPLRTNHGTSVVSPGQLNESTSIKETPQRSHDDIHTTLHEKRSASPVTFNKKPTRASRAFHNNFKNFLKHQRKGSTANIMQRHGRPINPANERILAALRAERQASDPFNEESVNSESATAMAATTSTDDAIMATRLNRQRRQQLAQLKSSNATSAIAMSTSHYTTPQHPPLVHLTSANNGYTSAVPISYYGQPFAQLNSANDNRATAATPRTHAMLQNENVDRPLRPLSPLPMVPRMKKVKKSFWRKVKDFFKEFKDALIEDRGRKKNGPTRDPLTPVERFPLRALPPRAGTPKYYNHTPRPVACASQPPNQLQRLSPAAPAPAISPAPATPFRSLSVTQRIPRQGSFPPAGTVTTYVFPPESLSDPEFAEANRAYARRSMIQYQQGGRVDPPPLV